jgi:hypothetical protein
MNNQTWQTGAVQESLRLSHGPAIRLPRVSPDKALKYGDHIIPPGVSPINFMILYYGSLTWCAHRPRSVYVLCLSTWTRPYFPTPIALILTAGSERPRRVSTSISLSLLLQRALGSVSESSMEQCITPPLSIFALSQGQILMEIVFVVWRTRKYT